MPRYIHNDTECRHEENGDAGFEVKVYSQDEVDQIQGEHLNLISAASELLAALESVITWAKRHKLNLADCIDGKQRECPVIMDARAAIAKARGAV